MDNIATHALSSSSIISAHVDEEHGSNRGLDEPQKPFQDVSDFGSKQKTFPRVMEDTFFTSLITTILHLLFLKGVTRTLRDLWTYFFSSSVTRVCYSSIGPGIITFLVLMERGLRWGVMHCLLCKVASNQPLFYRGANNSSFYNAAAVLSDLLTSSILDVSICSH